MPIEDALEDLVPQIYSVIGTMPGGILVAHQHTTSQAIAMVLDGRGQQPNVAEVHSCTLESGDHVHSFCHTGPTRTRNQDRILVYPDRSLVLVADGHEHLGGVVADYLAVCAVHYGPQQEKITRATENHAVWINPSQQKGGTVFVLTNILQSRDGTKALEYARRGDTQLIVLRRGRVHHRTIDETKGQEMRGKGIPEQEASRFDNVVVNSICARAQYQGRNTRLPSPLPLEKGDRVILGCDGVLKGKSDAAIEALSHAHLDGRALAEGLARIGFQSTDNISAAVIEIT